MHQPRLPALVRIALGSAFAFACGAVRPAAAQSQDWSVALCDTVIAYRGLATSWQYPSGLFLEGMWRVYQRTGDIRYFNYIKNWTDQFVASDGTLNLRGQTLDSLDNMMPGTALCHLYQVTHDARYRTAAATIRNRLATYPRTADGGLVHNTTVADELWLDGAFMVSIFLVNYGETFADPSAIDEAARQIAIYYSHLRYVKDATTNPATALGWHAWDQNASATWANRTTGLSPEVWCRAVGWFVVACTEILERLPADHPRRTELITTLSELLQGIKAYQDPTTGLWYEVVDKGNNATQWLDNWVEQSSGCMYTYALAKAIDAGYVSADAFRSTAQHGYEGILSNIEVRSVTSPTPTHDEVYVYGTCIGTNVGPLVVGDDSYAYYRDRTQSTNDLHGEGAFLFANELQRTRYPDLRQLVQAERANRDALSRVDSTNRGFTGEGYVYLGNTTASYLEATFSLATATTKRLVVRYANGASAGFPVQVSVNGIVVTPSLALPVTGAWTAWRSRTLDLALPAGTNTIRLQSTGGAGTLLLDWLALDTVPPVAPTGLMATVVSATRVDLAWTDASTNETGFTVERKSGAGGAFLPIASLAAGATSFSDSAAVAGAANTYRVIAFNGSGNSAASNEAAITTPPAAALFTRMMVVQRGGSLRLAASATSAGTLSYQWLFNDAPLANATSALLQIDNVDDRHAGSYRVRVSSGALSSTSNAATVTLATTVSRLRSLSTRARVALGAGVPIAGFVVSGSASKRLLIRAIGPALRPYGIDSPLPDPSLNLTTLAGVRITAADAITSADAAIMQQVGAFALSAGGADIAVVATLPEGAYTAIVTDKNGATGVGLVEIYDLEPGNGKLPSLSTRAWVGTGADVLIPGLAIEGNATKRVLVRAAGPALQPFAIDGYLADPQLEVMTVAGASLATNDNWNSNDAALKAASESVGAFPFAPGSKDAALLIELPPGLYTVVVRGANATTGIALVETYELP